MKFDYRKMPTDPTEAFPNRRNISRPHIRIRVKYNKKHIDVHALVDSGADYCIFPTELGRMLDIDIDAGKMDQIIGIGNKPYPVYYHSLNIEVGGHSVKIYGGFSDHVPLPILGQVGFFDKFDVRFIYRKKQIIIKPFTAK